MFNNLRRIGYIVTYYRLIKAISIRTIDRSGEVHINYFKEINKKCFRPLEHSSLRFTNILSFSLYCISKLITASIDKNDKHKIKFIFYLINKLLPSKFRYIISLGMLELSLMTTRSKGIYQFPFSLAKLKRVKFHDFEIFIPQNSKEVVKSIYGKNWKVPKKNWSFYDPKNKNFTEVKKINQKWNFRCGEKLFEFS